jgi:PAS domain S-box-containing protein
MPSDPKDIRALRRKAEKRLLEAPEKPALTSGVDPQGLVHELSVYQIELEMQNEELRRSQEQLERSRSEYADLYDFAPVGYLTFDKIGHVTRANLTACGLLGIERSILVKKPFTLFVHPESQDLFYLHKRKVVETTAAQTCELLLKKKDGTFFYAQLESIAVQVNGTPAIRAILTDITERKQGEWEQKRVESRLRQAHEQKIAEEALRLSEKQFRTLAEHLPDVIDRFDREMRHVYVNPAGLRVRGKEAHDIIGKTIRETGVPEPLCTVREERLQEVFATGEVSQLESHFQTVDGTKVYQSILVPEPDSEGNIAFVLVVSRDVTERNKREEELFRLNKTLKAHSAIDNAMMHATTESEYLERTCRIVVDDCGHSMVWIGFAENDEAKTVRPVACAGYEEGYLETLNVTWADTERGRGPTGTAIRSGKPSMCTNMLTDPAFTPWREEATKRGYASSIVFPLTTNDKTFGAITIYSKEPDPFSQDEIGLLSDLAGDFAYGITTIRLRNEHALAEEALRRAHDELEHRVEERTAELREAYAALQKEAGERRQMGQLLRQAQKMESIGTLAGGIAHDFNNILAAVIGFSEMARDKTPAGSPIRHHLDRVVSAGIRGRDLVKQILTFSREAGQDKQPLRISSVVKETVKLLRASLPSTIDIRTNTKSPSGFVLADLTQMHQVVMNLCTNAAHAMRQTGGIISISLSDLTFSSREDAPASSLSPGPYVKLSVTDTGEGMTPEVSERIFDPFYTTKDKGEGTGLGLSVVHGIVASHGGAITVSSEPGKGSTFTVYLPKHPENVASVSGQDNDPIAGGHERVLFVDDEEALAEMGSELLSELGYSVVSRTSSREALALFRLDPSRFDLIVSDITMPQLTGIELAREVRTLRPDMPVILCTGFSNTADPDTIREAGIRACVMKPLTKREVDRTIRKVLDEHASA